MALNIKDSRRYALLRLGLGCNVTCPFCNVPWESYDYPMKLSFKTISQKLSELAKSGSDRLEISGGEPTLRPDLPRIVSLAVKLGFKNIELQTNAILLGKSPRLCRDLKGAGLTHAFVGLHSQIPKIHDFLVGKAGAFEPCILGTGSLVRAGIETTVNPVLTVVNYKTLPGFVEYVAKELKGVRSISLSVVQPHGRAQKNSRLIPRYGEIAPYVERSLRRADELELMVNNPFCGLPMCVGGWHKRPDRNVEYCEALLGRRPGDGQKMHPPVCDRCDFKNYCGGVWLEYPLIHPIEDLTPIRMAGYESR